MMERFLASRIKHGTLHLEWPDGRRRSFGEGPPEALMRLRQGQTLRRIVSDPEFMLGQTYMDGEWDAGPTGLRKLLQVLMANFSNEQHGISRRLAGKLLRPLQQWNREAASRRNVAYHYDLDEALFRRFLDEDMQYSCAYFAPGIDSLEAAQQAKCAHIMRKLYLNPGQRVLDIGCGWGGLAIYLAKSADVSVTGLTLSREQARVAEARVAEQGLQERVKIRVEDYRSHQGLYDRVVSVGMFEHVGAPYYRGFFNRVHDLLTEDGIALMHTIGRCLPPGSTNPWIRRYIFPGGHIPAMSEVMRAVEPSGLCTADIEVLRLHYAETLAEWLRRFQQARAEIRKDKGERFCRMWEFYLAACEGSFRWRKLAVFQFQFSRRLDTLPMTRDYLYRDSSNPVPWTDRHSVAG